MERARVPHYHPSHTVTQRNFLRGSASQLLSFFFLDQWIFFFNRKISLEAPSGFHVRKVEPPPRGLHLWQRSHYPDASPLGTPNDVSHADCDTPSSSSSSYSCYLSSFLIGNPSRGIPGSGSASYPAWSRPSPRASRSTLGLATRAAAPAPSSTG